MYPRELRDLLWEAFKEGFENGRLFGHNTQAEDSRNEFDVWYSETVGKKS